MPKTAKQYAAEMEEMWAQADREGRDLTPGERAHMEQLVESTKSMHSLEQQMRELGGAAPSFVTRTDPNHSFAGGGPGDVFIASKGYKQIADPSTRAQTWSTGPVEVANSLPHVLLKGTLAENVGGAGHGGGLIPPFYAPGVVDKLFEPLGVADVFGQSTVSASQVRYVVEGTATNAAAGVAEAAAKPESTLGYTETTEAIRKIATVLPISDEMLEDAPSIQTYLNGRLTLFVKVEEERQLLRGAGAASNELLGIMGAGRGINTYTKLAADDNAVALAKVIANTAGSAFVQPDTIILHPSNWLTTRLLRDGTGGTAGQFYGGGPFSGAYGNGAAAGMFGQQRWNTRVVLSNYVGAGTALVGNFGQSAHIWRRSGVTVEATNSHSDFYVRNLSMLRAEERLGLGVFRPVAFTEVRGLT
jgi:HK97 family phage major capsid protein